MTQDTSDDSIQLLGLFPLLNKTVVSATCHKSFGYTKSQLLIFSALTQYDSLTMTQVAGYLSSSKEQATRAVAPLVDDGLIERYTDHENRTRIHIRLTETGKDFIQHYKEKFYRDLQMTIGEKLTQQERMELKCSTETLVCLLKKLNG